MIDMEFPRLQGVDDGPLLNRDSSLHQEVVYPFGQAVGKKFWFHPAIGFISHAAFVQAISLWRAFGGKWQLRLRNTMALESGLRCEVLERSKISVPLVYSGLCNPHIGSTMVVRSVSGRHRGSGHTVLPTAR